MGIRRRKVSEKSIIEKNGKPELKVGKPPVLDSFYSGYGDQATYGILEQYFMNMFHLGYRLKIFIYFLENYNKNGSEYPGIDGLKSLSGGRDQQVKLFIAGLKKDGFIKIIDGIEDLKSVYVMAREFGKKSFRESVIRQLKKYLVKLENKSSS